MGSLEVLFLKGAVLPQKKLEEKLTFMQMSISYVYALSDLKGKA
jgi:hypothetical protein